MKESTVNELRSSGSCEYGETPPGEPPPYPPPGSTIGRTHETPFILSGGFHGVPIGVDMANMSTRAAIMQAQQAVYDEMRMEFETMGEGGRYCERQKDYAFELIDEYGVRATARILHLPRRTLQRWCRAQCKAVRRCPDWVYSWAAKRRKRREFWAKRGY